MQVIKRDGPKAPFDPAKIRRWIKWSVQDLKDSIEKEYEILTKTIDRISDREVSTDEIHETIIKVCLEKEEIEYSRIAANLELATLFKNQERNLGLGILRPESLSFTQYAQIFGEEGIWKGQWVHDAIGNHLVDEWFMELESLPLEYWTVKQWSDKYSLQVNNEPVETPAMGALANALSLHGVNETAFLVAKDIMLNRTNYPTPMLNGCRNGDFNSISCCVIEGGDTIDSLEVAEHIASSMTAKKAGIGITLDTRSKGDPVKGGQIKHLGKLPLFKSIEASVKKFTQMCYSADTEILTDRGWVALPAITKETLVAQVTHDRTMEFVNPLQVFQYDAPEELISLKNRNMDLLVTKNHTMVYRGRKYDTNTPTFHGYREVTAEDLKCSRTVLLDFGASVQGYVDTLSPEDRFRLAVQADGFVKEHKTQEEPSYVFYFSKYRKIERLRGILEDMGLKEKHEKSKLPGYRVYQHPYDDGRPTATVFYVTGTGLKIDKSLSWIYSKGLSAQGMREALLEIAEWDGHWTTKTSFEYYCVDKDNIDVVQYLATCIGVKSTVDPQKDRVNYTVRVMLDTTEFYTETVKKLVVKAEPQSKVYCVEVPTNKLVVRRKGKTLVCGNSRGGSATMTIKCIDPDIMEMLLWKTQRIDLSQRVDKIDYSLAYNDSFVSAVLCDADWYLFSRSLAPEVHDAFYGDQDTYDAAVSKAIRKGVPYKKVKALDLLTEFIKSRWETGRVYCINVTSANEHTPFVDAIHQSNLCMEIQLPTTPYVNMQDLYSEHSIGETAFCSLAALNVAFIPKEEYFDVAYRALLTVDVMIEKAAKHAMSESMRNNLLKRRSIGIGITGLASYLYKNGFDYDGSLASLDEVEEVAELHYYALLKASQVISNGQWAEGIKQDWLPIDTMRSNKEPLLDWEALRGIPRKHSVLVAHMPTESSAVE